jgi:pimeloyl-ACP methyl ester carboxylesterase
MALAVEDRFVAVPGGRVFVRQWSPAGTASKSPIVLLHDSLGCVELWRDFPAVLARKFGRPVFAYDRLGFGQSDARVERPSAAFVDEEAHTYFPPLRDALGLTRYGLFGHSVGGAMALAIASEDAACEAVVTEAAQAFVEDRTLAGIRAAGRQFAQSAQFAKLERLHGPKARWVLSAWQDVWQSAEFAGWNLDARLQRIRCPALAIHGDRDEYGSLEFPRRIVRGIGPVARMAVLEGCGHVPHRERPDQVLSLVSEFMP